MPRLFVAVELPAGVKDRLVGLNTRIPTARWVKPEHMHLTLQFIGEAPDRRVVDVTSALEMVDCAGFDVQLQGVGRFPPQQNKAPRVLWVGIAPQPLLMKLQKSVEHSLKAAGFPPDGKAFHPHITLARLELQKPVKQADGFLAAQTDFSVQPFPARRFVLVRSVLSSQGPTYTIEAEYPLSAR